MTLKVREEAEPQPLLGIMLHDTCLDEGSLEVVHTFQRGKRLACIEDLAAPTGHVWMNLVDMADTGLSVG